MDNILLFWSIKYNGDWNKIAKAISNNLKISNIDLENCEKQSQKINYITILNHKYPQSLLKLTKPPFILFYKGNIELLKHPAKIAVIGSRNNSNYSKHKTINFVQKAVDNNYLIVSGMAKGIDSIAHQSALSSSGLTIAVLGSGIDLVYPASNKLLYKQIIKHGLVISEYPYSTPPDAKNFKVRNRIVAGLVNKIFVIEAKLKSGTMNTVKWGLEIGNDIYCSDAPGQENAGCHQLIKEGANPI